MVRQSVGCCSCSWTARPISATDTIASADTTKVAAFTYTARSMESSPSPRVIRVIAVKMTAAGRAVP